MATSATHRAASSPRPAATAPTFTEVLSGIAETWAQHRGPLIYSLGATVLATTGLLTLTVAGA